jgi:starvation-inducible DNA-binding protein
MVRPINRNPLEGVIMLNNQVVIDRLNGLLADATVFYQKLRHYHWNVGGNEFFTLHAKFEELYTAWAVVIDDVAERILTIEGVPLHTLASMLTVTRLHEDESLPAANEMVDNIIADIGAIRARAGEVIAAADQTGDRGTTNLMDATVDALEKNAWMLHAWKKDRSRSWS